MWQKLSDMGTRMSPQGSRVELAKKLRSAGMDTSPQTVMAAKMSIMIGGVLLGIVGIAVGQPILMPVGMMFAALGYIGPNIWLGGKIARRGETIARMLPDTLDLLTVSVEAGLGFDAAVAKVCEKMTGPLIDEMKIMSREIRVGATRRDALRNMGDRIGAEEVKSFTRAIIQAEELGASLGRTLRVQAQDMRILRQLAAEEKAMKAPVKMLFPTVLFIFPSMFIVILGPAALGIMEGLAQTH
jgi:tight adherence protein C